MLIHYVSINPSKKREVKVKSNYNVNNQRKWLKTKSIQEIYIREINYII